MIIRLLKAISAGTIVYFLIGYFVFNLILGAFSDRNTTGLIGFKKENGQTMLWIGLSCLAYSTLLTIILLYWQKEPKILTGLIKGAIIGILIACMADFYWFGTSNFYNNFKAVFADICAASVTVGIMGAAIVWAGRS